MIYTDTTTSPCRTFAAADGARFCRADHSVYFSDQTCTELTHNLGRISPVAEAVAVAHEDSHVFRDHADTYGRVKRTMTTLSLSAAGGLNAKL